MPWQNYGTFLGSKIVLAAGVTDYEERIAKRVRLKEHCTISVVAHPKDGIDVSFINNQVSVRLSYMKLLQSGCKYGFLYIMNYNIGFIRLFNSAYICNDNWVISFFLFSVNFKWIAVTQKLPQISEPWYTEVEREKRSRVGLLRLQWCNWEYVIYLDLCILIYHTVQQPITALAVICSMLFLFVFHNFTLKRFIKDFIKLLKVSTGTTHYYFHGHELVITQNITQHYRINRILQSERSMKKRYEELSISIAYFSLTE